MIIPTACRGRCLMVMLLVVAPLFQLLSFRPTKATTQETKSHKKSKIQTVENSSAAATMQMKTPASQRTHASLQNNSRPLNISFPVVVASLYKSGTTSVHSYFSCGQQRSVHKARNRAANVGHCIRRHIQKGHPRPLEGCGGGEYDVFSDLSDLDASPKLCYDPSVFDLEGLYRGYPNMTLILTVRDSRKWLDSVDRFRFKNWGLLPWLAQCQNLWPDQPNDTTLPGSRNLTPDELVQFYDWHWRHVKTFATEHPSITYLEVDLEQDDAAIGAFLEERIGISADCWGAKNVNRKHPKA